MAFAGTERVAHCPLVLDEGELLSLVQAIVSRMPASWGAWHLLAMHAWQRRYEAAGIALMSALAGKDARMWARVAQACLARGMPPRWVKAAA